MVRGVKRSVLTLWVLNVDISADGKMTYQMIYVTADIVTYMYMLGAAEGGV